MSVSYTHLNVAISYAPVETSDSISTDVNKGEYNISFKIASSSGSDDFVYGVKSDSQRSSANLFTTTFSSIGIGHAYSCLLYTSSVALTNMCRNETNL